MLKLAGWVLASVFLPMAAPAADASFQKKIDEAIAKGRAYLLQTMPAEKRAKAGTEEKAAAREAMAKLGPIHKEIQELWKNKQGESERYRELCEESQRISMEVRQDACRDRAIHLAAYALIVSGASRKDPVVRGLLNEVVDRIRRGEHQTYDLGLSILALGSTPSQNKEEYPQKKAVEYREEIEEAVRRLIKGQNAKGGWSYDCKTSGYGGDLSNTQFAALGLGLAAQLKIGDAEAAWQKLQNGLGTWYSKSQAAGRSKSGAAYGGGWGYGLGSYQSPPSGSMTCAGICSMILAESVLRHKPIEKIDHRKIPQVPPALDYIEGEDLPGIFETDNTYLDFYHLYSLERTGALCALEKIGKYAWYDQGAKLLLPMQNEAGDWCGTHGKTVDTSFALLFLSRATQRTYTRYTVGGESKPPEVGEEIREQPEEEIPPPDVRPLPPPQARSPQAPQ